MMKTTSERLDSVYCIPRCDNDWDELFNHPKIFQKEYYKEVDGMKAYCILNGKMKFEYTLRSIIPSKHIDLKAEIPVNQFIDLVDDSLKCLCRLAEDFPHHSSNPFEINIERDNGDGYRIDVCKSGLVLLDGRITNIKTYTQLLTFIEMIK